MNSDDLDLAKRIVARLNPQQSPEARAVYNAFVDEYCEGTFNPAAPLIFKKAVPENLHIAGVLGISTAMVLLPAIASEAE